MNAGGNASHGRYNKSHGHGASQSDTDYNTNDEDISWNGQGNAGTPNNRGKIIPVRRGGQTQALDFDVGASAEEWARNFARMDKFREMIRGPMLPPMPPTPPPAPPVQPPQVPNQGVDLSVMVGLFKTLADVMVAAVRGAQPQPALQPPPAPAVLAATPADPLTMANFERMLAALQKK